MSFVEQFGQAYSIGAISVWVIASFILFVAPSKQQRWPLDAQVLTVAVLVGITGILPAGLAIVLTCASLMTLRRLSRSAALRLTAIYVLTAVVAWLSPPSTDWALLPSVAGLAALAIDALFDGQSPLPDRQSLLRLGLGILQAGLVLWLAANSGLGVAAVTLAALTLLVLLTPPAPASTPAPTAGDPQLRQHISRLVQVNGKVRQLALSTDLENVARVVSEAVTEVLGADGVAVFLYNQDANTTELIHTHQLPASYPSSLAAKFDQQSPPWQIEDIRELAADHPAQPVLEAANAVATTEMLLEFDNENVGALAVYYNAPHKLTDEEQDLLRILADQLMVASQNAVALRALERYAVQTTHLVELSRISMFSLQPEEILVNAARLLRKAFEVDVSVLATLNPLEGETEPFIAVDHSHADFELPDEPPIYQLEELNALRTAENPSLRLAQVSDPTLSPAMRQFMMMNDLHLLIVAPTIANGRVLGVALLGSRSAYHPSDQKQRFIETAVHLIGAQLQNTQLYNITRGALVRRLEELSFIEQLSQEVASSLDVKRTIDLILRATRHVTQADRTLLVQRTHDGHFQIISESAGRRQNTLTKSINPVVGEVLETGQPVLLPAYQTNDGIGSLLAVPLRQEGAVVGALGVLSAQPDFFTEEQRRFLQSLASHTAISLANARYFEERQHRVDVLTRLQQLSLQVSGTRGKHPVASHILRAGLQIMDCDYGMLYHYNAEKHQVMPLAAPWMEEERSRTLQTIRISPDTCAAVIEAGHVQVWQPEEARNPTKKKLLLAPLMREPNVSELLVMAFDSNRHLSQRELESLDMLTSQAISHLENVTLYEQIHSASNRMYAILNSTRDSMILLDRNNAVVDYNRAAQQLMGAQLHATDQDFAAYPDGYEVLETDDTRLEMAGTAMLPDDQSDVIRRELVKKNEDGPSNYLQQLELPVHDVRGKNSGRLVVLRDISYEKALDEYRREITSMLVHDLRSPLSSVISGLFIALDEPDMEPDQLTKLLTPTLNSAERLMRLIETLLDVESEQMKLKRTEADLISLVAEATSALRYILWESKVDIKIDISPDVSLIYIDAEKIKRVFINLIDNAIDYSRGKIHIKATRTPQGVQVQISDDGPGVPASERDMLFKMFTQGNLQHMRRAKNSGVGLAFCKRTIEAHGGTIRIADGCELPGACFVFTLPTPANQD